MSHEDRKSWFEPLHHLWLRMKPGIVQEVPPENARCEFDCRKPDCTHSEWEHCDNRIKTAELERASRQQASRP